MTCPNCGKELKEGEVCTCTQNNEVQDEKPVEEINEEYTQTNVRFSFCHSSNVILKNNEWKE